MHMKREGWRERNNALEAMYYQDQVAIISQSFLSPVPLLYLLSFSLGKLTVVILFWSVNSGLHFRSTFLYLIWYLYRFLRS